MLNGIKGTRGLVLVRLKDNDKLIITAGDPYSLCHIPIREVCGKCILGNTQQKMLDYIPWGLCVNQNLNLVVADRSKGSLHVYNSSGDEINTIKLPSGVSPMYVASDLSGGYIVTGCNSSDIIWIDGQGAQQRRHQGTTASALRGVVRDLENRYLVADRDRNHLLLFTEDEGDVRCLGKDKITEPYSFYLDHQQEELYVGTWSGQVLVYDYHMLLREKEPIKYIITQMSIKSALSKV